MQRSPPKTAQQPQKCRFSRTGENTFSVILSQITGQCKGFIEFRIFNMLGHVAHALCVPRLDSSGRIGRAQGETG